MRATVILLFMILIAGCDQVTTEGPIGVPVAIDAADWDGIWLHEEAAITVRVTDAASGSIELAWVESRPDRLEMELYRGQYRRAGDWRFAVMPLAGDDGGDADLKRFLFALVRKETGRIVLWMPNAAAFRAAVNDGRLPGSIADEAVHLPAPDEALLEKLAAQGPELFDWQQPLVFIRVVH